MFTITEVTIRTTSKGQPYKALKGIYNGEEITANMWNDNPEYDHAIVGYSPECKLEKKGQYWNFDTDSLYVGSDPKKELKKEVNTQEQLNLIINQQGSLWRALKEIGLHLNIEWFKGSEDIRDHYHKMLKDLPEGEVKL